MSTAQSARIFAALFVQAQISYQVSWPSNFKKAGGALTLSTGAGAADVIKMRWDGANWREVSRFLTLS